MSVAVTLELIAQRAGVSVSTVSRALQDRHWVAPATKLRIRRIAEELGYTPDARLSELMGHLRARKVSHDQPALALLTTQPGIPDRTFKGGRNPINGILQQAKALGYRLETFATEQPGMTKARLGSIIWSRGITGLIVYPLEVPGTIPDFSWELFSSVVIGYSLREPALHRVVIDYHQSTHLCLTQALQGGSRKIGLLLSAGTDHRTNYLYRSAYLGFQDRVGIEKVGPMLVTDFVNRTAFDQWIGEHQFDTLVTAGEFSVQKLLGWLKELRFTRGRKPPKVLNLSLDSLQGGPGIYQDTMEVGMEAVRYLVQLIHSRETGLPDRPRLVSVAGVWVPADSASTASSMPIVTATSRKV